MNYKNVRLSTKEKISFISNLTTMLTAGIPILEAVNSLSDNAKGNSKLILNEMHSDLAEGLPVNMTLAKFSRVFDGVSVSLVRAAEEAGNLGRILKDLKINIQKQAEFSDKIKAALMYPAMIIALFFVIFLMILIVVVPKIASVFSNLPIQLPLPTRMLIAASNILLKDTLPLLAVITLLVATLVLIFRYNRNLILKPFLSLPLVSGLVAQIDLARFSYSMYVLLNSGLPITAALQLAADVVIRPDLATTIRQAHSEVGAGKHLSVALARKNSGVPPIVIKLIEVGERTGTLETSMKDVNEYMEYEVGNALKALTVLLEPLLLIFVGVAVGGIMLAIIAPIYGMIGQIGAR